MINIIPIGGIGEIGMNMVLVEADGEQILIDCGVLFPRAPYYGIEAIVPNYKDFIKKFPKVRRLFVTHGHEDHIGGIPYLISEKPFIIHATPYAAELIKLKCSNFYVNKIKPDVQTIEYDKEIIVGRIRVVFSRVCHSIPDASAIFINSKDGNILYLSDFKLGENKDIKILDSIKKLKNKYGQIDVLLSDSTNANDEGTCPAEDDVFKTMEGIFKRAKKKIIVTLFPSHIPRINQVIALCKKHKKKLFISGTNIKNHMSIASKLGYKEPDNGVITSERLYSKTDDKDIVLLCTGSQAEVNSSVSKLSKGMHPFASIKEGDTIIYSSSKIPGNERGILDSINGMLEKGADVITDSTDLVHSSGHACSDELLKVLNEAKPRTFIPVHGEFAHLKRHIELAVKSGVKRRNCFVLKPGNIFYMDEKGGGTEESGDMDRVFVDSITRKIIGRDTVKERKRMAFGGIIFVTITMNKKENELVQEPAVLTHGIFIDEDMKLIISNIQDKVNDYCTKKKLKSDHIDKTIKEIQNIAKREYRRRYDNKTEVLVQIIEV